MTQTPDTDLNQHGRREYTESAYIIEQMRKGVSVPKDPPTKGMGMMSQVWRNMSLDLHAADGYKKNGATVKLDGTEDHLIVRESGELSEG